MQTATRNESKTCRVAHTLFTRISSSSSRIHCTGKHQHGLGNVGHGKSCYRFHASAVREYGRRLLNWDSVLREPDDHLVIEMLRELDEDWWEILANCSLLRLVHHQTQDADTMRPRQLVTLIKKRSGLLSMRGFARSQLIFYSTRKFYSHWRVWC